MPRAHPAGLGVAGATVRMRWKDRQLQWLLGGRAARIEDRA
jgi:hypothetical protein